MRNSHAVESHAPQAAPVSSAASTTSSAAAPMSSVPISLYRELCRELRETQAALAASDQQKQQLIAQNQQLRQELQNLVQQVMQTQSTVTQLTTAPLDSLSSPAPLTSIATGVTPPVVNAAPQLLPPRTPQRRALRSVSNLEPDDRVSAGSEWISAPSEPWGSRVAHQASQFTQDLQGWKLALVMGAIVFSAFGAGFLIVRPFMAQQQSPQQQSPLPQTPQMTQPRR